MSGKTGKNSPNFGKRRTKEQLENYSMGAKKRWATHGDKLRQMMKSEDYRKANSDGQKESYVKNPNLKKVRSDSIHRFWSSSPLAPLLRKEASERAVKLLLENKIGPQAPFKRCTLKNPWTGEDEHMHSSWETAFFQACIDRGYEVTKNHGILIPYTHPDGSVRNYIPDFYAAEDRVLYEIKGRQNQIDDAKWEAARAYCEMQYFKFVVLSEVEEFAS